MQNASEEHSRQTQKTHRAYCSGWTNTGGELNILSGNGGKRHRQVRRLKGWSHLTKVIFGLHPLLVLGIYSMNHSLYSMSS